MKFRRERQEGPVNQCLRKTINGFKWQSNRSFRQELMPIEKVAEVAGNDAVHRNDNGEDNDFKGYIDSACGSLKVHKLMNHESTRKKYEKKRNKARIHQEHYYEKYQLANEDLKKEKDEYIRNKNLFAEQHGSYNIKKWIYYILLLALVVPELILSAMVFAFLSANPGTQYVIALTIAASVPLAGHFFGIMLRQGREEAGKGRWHKYLWILFALAVLMLISVASAIRAEYAETKYTLLLTIPLFFSLNATILFVAILLSYYRHNKIMLNAERKLNESKKNYKRLKKETKYLENRYIKAKLLYESSQADIDSSINIIDLEIDDIEKEGKKRKHVYDLTYDNVTEGMRLDRL